MRKFLIVAVLVSVFQAGFSQEQSLIGDYHVARTRETPPEWLSFEGSAIVKASGQGMVRVSGNFSIRISETTTTTAEFTADNCDIQASGARGIYPAVGFVNVTHSDGAAGRHAEVVKIALDFRNGEISIWETSPFDSRFREWQKWVKGGAPDGRSPNQPSRSSSAQPPTGRQTNVACSVRGPITQDGFLSVSSGNAAIDKATDEELGFLKHSFLVSPAFFYYDDSRGENAFSTPDQLGGSDSEDGTVCFGLALINRQISLSANGTNVPVILAHEFAHTVARKYGLSLSGKQNELFADYLAGGYMYYRSRNFKTTDISAAVRSFYNMGDNNFTDVAHHGAPESRSTCLRQGYSDCLRAAQQGHVFNLDEGVKLAKEYVTRHDLP